MSVHVCVDLRWQSPYIDIEMMIDHQYIVYTVLWI